MSWARTCLRIDWLHEAPLARGNAIPVKVVDSVVAIIPTEDVDASVVHDCGVPVTWRRWLGTFLGNYLKPVVRLEAESEEVIPSVSSIVSSENIKVVFERDRGMERSWAWRVTLVGLRWLNLVPGVRLLEEVVARATYDVLSAKRVRR